MDLILTIFYQLVYPTHINLHTKLLQVNTSEGTCTTFCRQGDMDYSENDIRINDVSSPNGLNLLPPYKIILYNENINN